MAAMPCGMESVISATNMTTIAFFIGLPLVPAALTKVRGGLADNRDNNVGSELRLRLLNLSLCRNQCRR
jgi:hypothetical protein